MAAVAAVLAVLIVVAWFPASDLLHQRQQLASDTSQLNALRRSNAALDKEAKRLKTPAEVGRIAAEQDGLVAPGQQSFEVLPPSSATSAGGASRAGNGTKGTGPGAAPGSGAGAGSTTGAASRGSGGSARHTGSAGSTPGFVGRVLRTLEFWR